MLPVLPTEMRWSSFMRPILQTHRIHEKRTVIMACSITRILPYLLLFSSNRFTIQIVRHGVLITSPFSSKEVSADFIPISQDISEQIHDWTIIADGSVLSILLDNAPIWSHIQIDPFDKYIIGETSLDSEHGGIIRIKEISIIRTTVLH